MLKRIFKIIIVITISGFFTLGITMPIKAELLLTQEEQNFIVNNPTLKTVSIEGIAPFIYTDSKGEIRGIGVSILERIAEMTGLVFEYKLYETVEESLASDFDIYLNANKGYAPQSMKLSNPYLKAKTILYFNASLESTELENKTYAAIKGGKLPEGVKEENAIYYDNREETLNAIERGKADYSYGNPYSVAFYTMQNGYKNIVTVPIEKEAREYCIGMSGENEILLSIMNKAIAAIDESQMQILILDATSRVERKITFSMVMDAYGKMLFGIMFFVMSILLWSLITNIRTNSKLEIQNKRYEMLSNISNEYLFEFYVAAERLILSEKCIQLFGSQEKLREAMDSIKRNLLNEELKTDHFTLQLILANGEPGVFKVVTSNIYDHKGKKFITSGKLVDISKEAAEKEELITKSQMDGLTGLYNASTTKDLIIESIKAKDAQQKDALIIFDYDKFKSINDTYGHLTGDQVLKNVSKGLGSIFRKTDIIGRIGGDEFCIYLQNVPSVEFIHSKCRQLNVLVQELNQSIHISSSIGSIGVILWREKQGEQKAVRIYDSLFKKADEALYQAKGKGGGQVVICDES